MQPPVGNAQDKKAPQKMPVNAHCGGGRTFCPFPRRQSPLLHPLNIGWSRDEPGMMASMTQARARKALVSLPLEMLPPYRRWARLGWLETQSLVTPLTPADWQPVRNQLPNVVVDPRPPADRRRGVALAEPSRTTPRRAQPAVGA